MTTLRGHGISIDVPRGWEGRIFVPDLDPPAINMPILHLTDTVLTQERSSFAPELAARFGPGGTLIALLEFDGKLADMGLYAPQGLALPLQADHLNPKALQFPNPDQAGHQRFFSTHGRAFCLYVVVGVGAGKDDRLRVLNDILGTLEIAKPGGGA
jgi:hypothetical protein